MSLSARVPLSLQVRTCSGISERGEQTRQPVETPCSGNLRETRPHARMRGNFLRLQGVARLAPDGHPVETATGHEIAALLERRAQLGSDMRMLLIQRASTCPTRPCCAYLHMLSRAESCAALVRDWR